MMGSFAFICHFLFIHSCNAEKNNNNKNNNNLSKPFIIFENEMKQVNF